MRRVTVRCSLTESNMAVLRLALNHRSHRVEQECTLTLRFVILSPSVARPTFDTDQGLSRLCCNVQLGPGIAYLSGHLAHAYGQDKKAPLSMIARVNSSPDFKLWFKVYTRTTSSPPILLTFPSECNEWSAHTTLVYDHGENTIITSF